MAKKRATALSNSPTLLQLWDALGSKLIEATQGQLPSKQRVVGSNPARDALASIYSYSSVPGGIRTHDPLLRRQLPLCGFN